MTLLIVLMAASGMRVSSQYTDIVLDEHHAFEALYALIVWEGCDDIDAIAGSVRHRAGDAGQGGQHEPAPPPFGGDHPAHNDAL